MSLLVTLAFIVIITILVVGFAETVRLARPAAASYLERSRADQFARSGVERVIAILNQYTADTNRNWVGQPGQLVVSDGSSAQKVLNTLVPLYSGSVASGGPTNGIYAPAQLNVVTFRDPGTHLITDRADAGGSIPRMEAKWIYVRRSGDLDTNATPAISTTDPIVGRYAYWTDDESSKLNYNIAWGKTGNTNAPGHPTRVDLSALTNFTQGQADVLHNFVVGGATNFNFFNTPFDARRIELTSSGSGIGVVLDQNKFELTHFNSDPNTTFFNEPRIVLTTRPDRAGWTYTNSQWVGVNGKPWPDGRPFYLRSLKNEGVIVQPNVISSGSLDPGRVSALDVEKVSETINMLALASSPQPSYMQRGDWPMVSGSASIQDKYYSQYPVQIRNSRLAQLALNIIDYVRAKESPQTVVEPIRGQFSTAATTPNKVFEFADNATNSYMGISRGPYMTEIGAWGGTLSHPVSAPSSSSFYRVPQTNEPVYAFKFEFYLPKNYGIPEVDLSALTMLFGAKTLFYYSGSSNVGVNQGYCAFKLDAPGAFYNPSNPGTPNVLKAGTYAVYTHVQNIASQVSGTLFVATNMPSPRPTSLSGFRAALGLGAGNTALDLVPVSTGTGSIDGIPVDAETVAENAITTIETDDPRVNKQRGDWTIRGSGNTLGSENGRYSVGKPASTVQPPLASGAPQRDTDASGNISDASFYMPPPAGKKFTRADGSIDDNTLGQVMSVGELGYIHTGIESSLFVKMGSQFYTAPPGTPWRSLRLQPNNDSTSVVPDWALVDLFTAPIAAPNPYNKYVYAPHDTSFGGRVNLNSKAIPYDLARVAPLAAVFQNGSYDATDATKKLSASEARTLAQNVFDRVLAANGKQYGHASSYDSVGEMVEMKGVADAGEKSEELFRQTANLLSTRGNTYSVYSIGQAIQQSPSGKLNIMAEQRIQAMVERYADSTNSVHFSPVYFRNLNP